MSDPLELVAEVLAFDEEGDTEIKDPSIPKVIEAIKSMDGDERSGVYVFLKSGVTMELGGGENGQVKCHVVPGGNKIFDLVNRHSVRDVTDMVPVVFIDTEYMYPRCTIVSFEIAISAASYFCKRGEMNPDLVWDDSLKYDIAE